MKVKCHTLTNGSTCSFRFAGQIRSGVYLARMVRDDGKEFEFIKCSRTGIPKTYGADKVTDLRETATVTAKYDDNRKIVNKHR